MITKENIKKDIVFWYRKAKENKTEELEKAMLIAIGRGKTYISIAWQEDMITNEEARLLTNAYNRLW